PYYINGMINLGSAMEVQGRLDEAAKYNHMALNIWPESPHALFNLGMVSFKKNDLENARHFFELSLEKPGALPLSHFFLGLTLERLALLPLAENQYQLAIAAKAMAPEASHHLGLIALNRGENDKALALFRQAVALNPGLSEAHMNLAELYRKNGSFDLARRQAEKAAHLGFSGASEFLRQLEKP
ncbi:MAG: tetratricopeptide repeat protein, partial [Deltaproteobacteria bacterium]|nr:tetratricopeptide repeat protein [Deltaproteobacteria bacterium]